MNRICFLTTWSIVSYCTTAYAQVTVYQENFDGGTGGATTVTVNTPAPGDKGEWIYSSTAGVGGSGAWATAGGTTGSYPNPIPFEQRLILPSQTLTAAGDVTFSFDHRYNFETTWDGGALMINVNSSGWTQVTTFTQGGYSSAIQSQYDWGYSEDMNDLAVWSGNSGGYITTTATLGEFVSGDSLEVMFRGGWDWFSKESNPNWAIDNLVMSLDSGTAIPEPKTLGLILGLFCLCFIYWKRTASIVNAGVKP